MFGEKLDPFHFPTLRNKRRMAFEGTYPGFLGRTYLFLLRIERIYKVYPEEANLEIFPFGITVTRFEIYIGQINRNLFSLSLYPSMVNFSRWSRKISSSAFIFFRSSEDKTLNALKYSNSRI